MSLKSNLIMFHYAQSIAGLKAARLCFHKPSPLRNISCTKIFIKLLYIKYLIKL